MNFKKILSGPFIWIFAAVLVLLIGSSLISGSTYKEVDTSYGLQLIEDGKVESITVMGTDQRVDMTLRSADAEFGKQVQFYFVTARGAAVTEAISEANLKSFNDDVQKTPWFLVILGTLLPFIIIGAIFWFLMSGLQGGNSKVMNFGKSKAKMVTKEQSTVTFADVAGADEALEELQEIKEFFVISPEACPLP